MNKKIIIEHCVMCPHSFLDYVQDENDDIEDVLFCIYQKNQPSGYGRTRTNAEGVPSWGKLEDN